MRAGRWSRGWGGRCALVHERQHRSLALAPLKSFILPTRQRILKKRKRKKHWYYYRELRSCVIVEYIVIRNNGSAQPKTRRWKTKKKVLMQIVYVCASLSHLSLSSIMGSMSLARSMACTTSPSIIAWRVKNQQDARKIQPCREKKRQRRNECQKQRHPSLYSERAKRFLSLSLKKSQKTTQVGVYNSST